MKGDLKVKGEEEESLWVVLTVYIKSGFYFYFNKR